MRVFELHRDRDISGVSGTGLVAQGVAFDDGTVALRWAGDWPSTVIHHGIESVQRIHCHGGATRVVWVDNASAREHANLMDEINSLYDQLAQEKREKDIKATALELAMGEDEDAERYRLLLDRAEDLVEKAEASRESGEG